MAEFTIFEIRDLLSRAAKIACGARSIIYSHPEDTNKIIKITTGYNLDAHVKAAKYELATQIYSAQWVALEVLEGMLTETATNDLCQLSEKFGRMVQIIVMQRADPILPVNLLPCVYDSVKRKGRADYERIELEAYDLYVKPMLDFLADIGIRWIDSHVGNIGMVDGHAVVLDF